MRIIVFRERKTSHNSAVSTPRGHKIEVSLADIGYRPVVAFAFVHLLRASTYVQGVAELLLKKKFKVKFFFS